MRRDACLGAAADAAPTSSSEAAVATERRTMRLRNIGAPFDFLRVSALPNSRASGLRRRPVAGFPQLPGLRRAVLHRRAETNARVDDHAAAREAEDRVEVELGDLREVDGEPGEPVEERDERVGVD